MIYEGLDPVTGRERRTWHTAGPNRHDAEKLAKQLAAKSNGRQRHRRMVDVRPTSRNVRSPPSASNFARARGTGTTQVRPSRHPHDRTDRDPSAAPERSRSALRAQAAPNRRQQTAVCQVRAGNPPHHPQRARRRPPPRSRLAQRRARRQRPQTAQAPPVEPQTLDRRSAGPRQPPITACSRRSGSPPHRHAPQRTTRPAMARHRLRHQHRVGQPRHLVDRLRQV